MRRILRTELAEKQSERRGGVAHCRAYRHRTETEKRRDVHYAEASHKPVNCRPGFFDGGCKLNNERGRQCRGQGCRHQNAAAHAQPTKGGGRQAKWSNPNPKSSGVASSAKKSRKNFKQRK